MAKRCEEPGSRQIVGPVAALERGAFDTSTRCCLGICARSCGPSYGMTHHLWRRTRMIRFSIFSAAVLLLGSPTFATAQGASRGENPPTQCWDQRTSQLRQRSSTETVSRGPASDPEESTAGESGSSEGMAALAPGSKGSASERAAAESVSPSGSPRPPGMPHC